MIKKMTLIIVLFLTLFLIGCAVTSVVPITAYQVSDSDSGIKLSEDLYLKFDSDLQTWGDAKLIYKF